MHRCRYAKQGCLFVFGLSLDGASSASALVTLDLLSLGGSNFLSLCFSLGLLAGSPRLFIVGPIIPSQTLALVAFPLLGRRASFDCFMLVACTSE